VIAIVFQVDYNKTIMTQKVIKVGDSVAVSPAIAEVDKELLSWTKKFIERYRPALEALADK